MPSLLASMEAVVNCPELVDPEESKRARTRSSWLDQINRGQAYGHRVRANRWHSLRKQGAN